jgi:hypothetical protein
VRTKQRLNTRLKFKFNSNSDKEEVTIPLGVVASFIYCSILQGFSNWNEKNTAFVDLSDRTITADHQNQVVIR